MKIHYLTVLTLTLLGGIAHANTPVITKPLPEPPPPCEAPADGEALYCPDNELIHVEYLNSSNPTANRIINTAINEYISPELAARTHSADGIPSDSDYYPAIEQYIRDNSTSYSMASLDVTISSLDGYCGLAQYGVDIDFYSGGASTGWRSWRFAVGDNGQITPKTFFIPGKQIEVERLVEDALYRYLIEASPDGFRDDPNFGLGGGYRSRERQDISPYIYLAPDGVHLQYQSYELLPRNYGEPNLVLPWQWLDGIVEPRFMPENCQ